MSEVLLVLPEALPTLTEASGRPSSAGVSSRGSTVETTHTVTSMCGTPAKLKAPGPLSIHDEERCERMVLLLECQVEYVALVKWRSVMEARQTKLRLRDKTEALAMQEAVLQHRISRLAYFEERCGKTVRTPAPTTATTIGMTPERGVGCEGMGLLPPTQEELVKRAQLGLQETQERLTIWAKLISERSLMRDEKLMSVKTIQSNVRNSVFSIISTHSAGTGGDEYLLRKRISQLRHDFRRICEVAEVLSYTLDLDTEKSKPSTEYHTRSSRDTFVKTMRVNYPVTVMELTVQHMDELRTRLYKITGKQRDTELALKRTKRKLSEEEKHRIQLQKLVNGIDDMAETVASQCQLRLPKREGGTVHGEGGISSSSGTEQQKAHENEKQERVEYFMPETYTTRVLQELCRYAVMLVRQVAWQEEKMRGEIQKRDVVLQSVCGEVKKFAALIRPTLYSTEICNIAEGVTTGNVAQVLESVLARVVPFLRENNTHQEGNNNHAILSEVASLQETIGNLRATVELLSREKCGNPKNANGNSVIPPSTNTTSCGVVTDESLPCVYVEGSHASRFDELTMVLRRLEEVRKENIMLEIALQGRRNLQPRMGQTSFLRSALPGPINTSNAMKRGTTSTVMAPPAMDMESGMSQEEADDMQNVHRLHEANKLLQHELKLEREAVESLKSKLSDSERFIRELQKQCHRLRQSGRFDIHEIIYHSGSDDDMDDYEAAEGEGDSDDDDDDENIDENDWINESRNETSNLRFGASPPSPPLPEVTTTVVCGSSKREQAETVKEGSLVDSRRFQIEGQKHQKGSTSLSSTSSPPRASMASSLSCTMTSLSGVMEPIFDLPRNQQMACLRDLTQLVHKLRTIHGLIVSSLDMKKERRMLRCQNNLYDVGNAFIACGISLHTFFKPTGPSAQISHHVAILYPLPPVLSHRLPSRQLLYPLKHKKGSLQSGGSKPTVKLFDLREEFQSVNKYLRGCMDVALSHDGRFIYALRSADPDVLARLCSPECLGVPVENRFCFSAVLPKEEKPPHRSRDSLSINSNSNTILNLGAGAGGGTDDAMPMDMLGWCGRGGICAWGVECMQFECPSEKSRFERHLDTQYRLVLRLSSHELRHFVGGSLEMMGRTRVGKTVPRLFMTVTAFDALTPEHRLQLLQWYGGMDGLSVVSLANMERSTGAPLRRLVAMAQWHGRVPLTRAPPRVTLRQLGIEVHEEEKERR